MSVDGFSMSNFGLPNEITSAQAAARTEQNVIFGNEKIVDKIEPVLNKRINNKTDEDEEDSQQQYFNDGFQKNKDDDDEENEEKDENRSKNESELDEKDKKITTKAAKKYKTAVLKNPEDIVVKVNTQKDKIELYNKVTQKTVESISANDFLEMINKLDYNSGILLNKSV